MKKKFRDITVDDIKYGWIATYDTLTIWLNKKIIRTINVEHCTVTPKLVAECIKELNAIKTYYFEGNLMWGYIKFAKDVQELLKVYPYEQLRKAQRLHDSAHFEVPQFGFYAEYSDPYTLGQWIDENKQEKFYK
jgi:hypothetical protein